MTKAAYEMHPWTIERAVEADLHDTARHARRMEPWWGGLAKSAMWFTMAGGAFYAYLSLGDMVAAFPWAFVVGMPLMMLWVFLPASAWLFLAVGQGYLMSVLWTLYRRWRRSAAQEGGETGGRRFVVSVRRSAYHAD